ncbi:gas vesicle protein GvpK [Parafrankia colletiae]|uniref:Gas vesicle protein GvpK n=1 Tax=Parafrankia colletiae TaxID=573497 RepID=A0A1S1QPM2_9ACTN|nr:gas vesicle protein K [Parafrankia colletiae]MCK9904326.1 gas vesicle protein K [Frankia sp. Cpl3]OHV36688.1 gas vesicle protein GvpK [Parafrankia colletiae]
MTTAGRDDGRRLRLDADPDDVGRGLGQLVVVVLELLREVLERQAIRRMEGGGLTAAQIDDLGRALLEIRASLVQVRESLGLSAQDADAAVARAGRILAADDSRADPRASTRRTSGSTARARPDRRVERPDNRGISRQERAGRGDVGARSAGPEAGEPGAGARRPGLQEKARTPP